MYLRALRAISSKYGVPAALGAVVLVGNVPHTIVGTPLSGGLRLRIRHCATGEKFTVHPTLDITWPSIRNGQVLHGADE